MKFNIQKDNFMRCFFEFFHKKVDNFVQHVSSEDEILYEKSSESSAEDYIYYMENELIITLDQQLTHNVIQIKWMQVFGDQYPEKSPLALDKIKDIKGNLTDGYLIDFKNDLSKRVHEFWNVVYSDYKNIAHEQSKINFQKKMEHVLYILAESLKIRAEFFFLKNR